MTNRAYDTRGRDKILAAEHFDRYRGSAGLDAVGLRELRTLDAFFRFADSRGIAAPAVEDFLGFVAADASPRKLENLRTALRHLEPASAAVHETLRTAIRQKKPRSRVCDRRPREQILAAPHMAPYRNLTTLPDVPLEELRVLERFLRFAAAERIEVPRVEDFLRFASEAASSRSLRSLKRALEILLPGNPAVNYTLQEAIRAKAPPRTSGRGGKERPTARLRLPLHNLPVHWQQTLEAMRSGVGTGERLPPAESVIDSLEDVLREYAKTLDDGGLPIAITIEGVRLFENARAARAAEKPEPRYTDDGNRPATRHTALQRLRLFTDWLDLDPELVSGLAAHENAVRRELTRVVKLKEAKLERLPGLRETWDLAGTLRLKGTGHRRRQTQLRLINEAAILALWTLVPLRLRDGRLRWGEHVYRLGDRYMIDVVTGKEDEPLRGRLHRALTPFLDTLILNGIDPAHLDVMRQKALAERLPLFRDTSGRMLSRGHPSRVWRTHLGTGAHIARSRIHTELARLGPEGVEAALALTAHRDARSREHYRAREVQTRMMERGQDLVDGLFEALEE